MISIIILARNEKYLTKTVEGIYSNAEGDFETIIVLDGETDYPIPDHYPDLTIIENPEPIGIVPSLEKAVAASEGEYLIKLDSHCAVDEGFDVKLRNDYEDNWVVVPRRYTLDLSTWEKYPRIVDYFYLSCPWTHPKFMMQSCPWISGAGEKSDILIDDLMAFQGSMWFMSRKHWDRLGIFNAIGDSYAEHHEISMRTWLGGGRVVINKNTWYAHPARNDDRGYQMSFNKVFRDHKRSALYWTGNKWADRIHDYDWLIDKFWPLPTERKKHRLEKYFWPEDWRNYYDRIV